MIVICSEQALNPSGVAKVCRDNPHEEVYALPWVTSAESLKKNFRDNRTKPNRLFPCVPNVKDAEGERMEFYKRFEDDAFGTMADALKQGKPVLNETMECPCRNGFYGNVLVPSWVPGSVVILRCKSSDLLPHEPLSAKLYAMTTVPVMVRNTDEIAKRTGCPEQELPVLLATDFIPRIGVFMQFYQMFSGKDWIFSIDPELFPERVPLRWRHNRAYKVV